MIFSDDQQVIKLPNSAIFFEDHYFCYVIENDIAKKVAVEISDSDNTNISVISPIIKSGDQVVVSGKKGLYDGAKVFIDNTSVVSPWFMYNKIYLLDWWDDDKKDIRTQ